MFICVLMVYVSQNDPSRLLQTAERLRKDFPEHGWLHLTGLIHDLGKIMAMYGEPQWAVSDTADDPTSVN